MKTGSTGKEEFLSKLSRIIEDHLDDPRFGVAGLSKELGMSRSNLHRRIKDAAGCSVNRYIRKVRLENAMILLTETSQNVSEVRSHVFPQSNFPFIKLAALYSTLGDRDKAITCLRKNTTCHALTLSTLKSNPAFDMIRDEPAFQEILQQAEEDYRKQHLQIAQLLKSHESFASPISENDVKP